jgi:hypothetical protein
VHLVGFKFITPCVEETSLRLSLPCIGDCTVSSGFMKYGVRGLYKKLSKTSVSFVKIVFRSPTVLTGVNKFLPLLSAFLDRLG